jgi:hypothetical protein
MIQNEAAIELSAGLLGVPANSHGFLFVTEEAAEFGQFAIELIDCEVVHTVEVFARRRLA